MPTVYPSVYVSLNSKSDSKIDLAKSLEYCENNTIKQYKWDATPQSHFYWFKKLYEFYQIPSNEKVDLEAGIKAVIRPHLEHMTTAYARIQKLYLDKMTTNEPVVSKLLADRNCFYKKIVHLSRQMPRELMELAKTCSGYREEEALEEVPEAISVTNTP